MKKSIATECKFVRHIPRGMENEDTHLAVLQHHYDDGSSEKELKLIENYQRPFWVTKKLHQKYKQKKEYEPLSRLQMFKATQSDVVKKVCQALEILPSPMSYKTIKNSPYLYGYEVPASSFIKHIYDIRSNNYFSSYKVVNLDIEFDITGKYNDISIITLSMNGRRHTAALRRLYRKISKDDDTIIKKIKEMSMAELPDGDVKKNCKQYDVTLHDNDLDLLKTIFNLLHEIKPDFATFHNMIYDLSRIFERLSYHKYPPEDLFCDPAIPKNLRRVVFKPAKQFKFKKGTKVSIPIEEQWTTIDIVASFMIMDTMTSYAFIRQAAGKVVGGYSLENLLKTNKIPGKLFYEDEYTKDITKEDWHKYMSEHRPIEYTIYAEQDTVAMTELENKTQDFTQTLPIFAGIADFNRFNSSTHKTICDGYIDYREKNLIIGTTPADPMNWSILGTRNWIKTLPSPFLQDIGLEITNIPGLKTNVTAHADDIDCVSSYPSDIQAGNISGTTCIAELYKVSGFELIEFKDNNINLITSNSNNTEYCTTMLSAPTIVEMVDLVHDKIYNVA